LLAIDGGILQIRKHLRVTQQGEIEASLRPHVISLRRLAIPP